MSQIAQIISIALIVSLAVCSAAPGNLNKLKLSKSNRLARQEAADDIPNQTPYPPAGIEPVVRFALPTENKLEEPEKTYLPPMTVGEPAKTYGVPSKIYGPPEADVKDQVEEVFNDEPQAQESQTAEPRSEAPDAEDDSSQKSENDEQSEEESQKVDRLSIAAGIEADEIEAETVKTEEELKKQLPARLMLSKSSGRQAAKLQIPSPQIVEPIYFFNYNGQLYRLLN